MFLTIVITALVTSLGMISLFLSSEQQRLKREIKKLDQENNNLAAEIQNRNLRRMQREQRDAYNRGLYDGRTTDEIYRKLLEKHSAGEQATVIMKGEL